MILLTGLLPALLLAQDYEKIEVKKLPKGVQTYVNENMPGGTIVNAAQATSNGRTVYAAVIEFRESKRIMIFDEKGNFLRKADNLSSANEPAPPKEPQAPVTYNTQPERELTPLVDIPASALPEEARNYIQKTFPNGIVKEVKKVDMGENILYQVVIRDPATDNVYFFNGKGNYLKHRSYQLKDSPYLGKYPL